MNLLSRLIAPVMVILLTAQTPKLMSENEAQNYRTFAKTRPVMVCYNGDVVYLDYVETDSTQQLFAFPMTRNIDSVGFVERNIDGVADYFVRMKANPDGTIGCEVATFDDKKTDSLANYYTRFTRHCIDPNAKCK